MRNRHSTEDNFDRFEKSLARLVKSKIRKKTADCKIERRQKTIIDVNKDRDTVKMNVDERTYNDLYAGKSKVVTLTRNIEMHIPESEHLRKLLKPGCILRIRPYKDNVSPTLVFRTGRITRRLDVTNNASEWRHDIELTEFIGKVETVATH